MKQRCVQIPHRHSSAGVVFTHTRNTVIEYYFETWNVDGLSRHKPLMSMSVYWLSSECPDDPWNHWQKLRRQQTEEEQKYFFRLKCDLCIVIFTLYLLIWCSLADKAKKWVAYLMRFDYVSSNWFFLALSTLIFPAFICSSLYFPYKLRIIPVTVFGKCSKHCTYGLDAVLCGGM